jgi:hypothetical protein
VNAAAKNFRQWTSGRKAAAIAAAVLLIVGILFGGWTLYGKFAGGSADQSKRVLWKYLAKEARTKNFKPDLDLSNVTLTTAARTVMTTVTNKSGNVKTVTRVLKPAAAVKAGSAALPETSLSTYFRTNQMQAESYQEMYLFIGQQLFVANQLFGSTNQQQQAAALVLASEASTYARTNALNLWLGARICEAFLWPNLVLAEKTNGTALTTDVLLSLCQSAFLEAGETNNIIRNYEYMIAKVSRSPAYVDLLRYQLAHIYQDLGEEEKALPLLKEIKNYRMNRVPQEIAALEQRVKKK